MDLRVANWNIWGRYGDFRGREPAIASTLRAVSADVVGLVEIWWDDDEAQIERLASELGYPHYASAEVGICDGVPWGVGVLSRLPIVEQERLEFANAFEGQPPGVALITMLESSSGAFDFVCLCEWGMSWSALGASATSDRLWAYQLLARTLAERRRSLAPVVVGDFNTIPEHREIRVITGKEPQIERAMSFVDAWEFVHGAHGGWTVDGLENRHLGKRALGRHRIDYIMTGAGHEFDGLWRVNAVEVFGKAGPSGEPPSDHYGVHADLSLVAGVVTPSDDYVIPR